MNEPLHVGSLTIDPQKERKFVLIAAAISIIGFILYVRRTASSGNSTVLPSSLGGGSTTTNTSTDTSGLASSITALQDAVKGLQASGTGQDVEIKYGYDNSNKTGTTSQGTGTTSGSGSGGLSLFGISIGGGGSKSSSNTHNDSVSQSNSAVFTTDTVIKNATPGTLQSIEDFLLKAGGTYQQQQQSQVTQSQEAYTYATGKVSPMIGVR